VLAEATNALAGIMWGCQPQTDGRKLVLYNSMIDVSNKLSGLPFSMHYTHARILGYEPHWISGCSEPYADNMSYRLITGWPDGFGNYETWQSDYMGTGSYFCNGQPIVGYWQQSSAWGSCVNYFGGDCPCADHVAGNNVCTTRPE
jgi:hypothetical protein